MDVDISVNMVSEEF